MSKNPLKVKYVNVCVKDYVRYVDSDLWQKTSQNKDEYDEGGDHACAHPCRVVEHLTPSREPNVERLHSCKNEDMYINVQLFELAQWLSALPVRWTSGHFQSV